MVLTVPHPPSSTLELKARLQMLLCKSIYLSTIYRQLILHPYPTDPSSKVTKNDSRWWGSWQFMDLTPSTKKEVGGVFVVGCHFWKKGRFSTKDGLIFGCLNCKNKSTKQSEMFNTLVVAQMPFFWRFQAFKSAAFRLRNPKPNLGICLGSLPFNRLPRLFEFLGTWRGKNCPQKKHPKNCVNRLCIWEECAQQKNHSTIL